MASRKATAGASARKAPAKASPEPRMMSQAAVSDSRIAGRLLREAAWSRMFGRTEAKNPFAR
jgi:hypothetical protein